jgi:hypothetical protein
MKMTKIESARIIVEQEGSCVHVECKKCFTTREKCGCKKLITISWTERKLALAKAYIKRHESKTKKKDHILDTTKKVEEPKPIKTVGIDNSDVTLVLTAQHEPTVKENLSVPQPIKLPDFVYSASKNGVGFIDTKNRTFNTNDKGELLINDKPCFATPEEALQVAKKLWNGEGK